MAAPPRLFCSMMCGVVRTQAVADVAVSGIPTIDTVPWIVPPASQCRRSRASATVDRCTSIPANCSVAAAARRGEKNDAARRYSSRCCVIACGRLMSNHSA